MKMLYWLALRVCGRCNISLIFLSAIQLNPHEKEFISHSGAYPSFLQCPTSFYVESILIRGNFKMFEKQKGQTITPQNMGSLTCLANRYGEETGDRAYGLLFLSENTGMSNYLQM